MGNSTTTRVMDKGEVPQKFASGKLFPLSNVLYVPSYRINLGVGIILKKLV